MKHPCATAQALPNEPHARQGKRNAKLLPLLAAVFLAASAQAVAAPQEMMPTPGRDAYQTGLKQLSQLAAKGDAEAQFILGTMHANGQGVPQDYRQAAAWYRKAAEQGHARAQYHLGAMYDIGQGVPQDYRQAAMWFRKAAEQEAANSRAYAGQPRAREMEAVITEHATARVEISARPRQTPEAPLGKAAADDAMTKPVTPVGVAQATAARSPATPAAIALSAAEAAPQKDKPVAAHKTPARDAAEMKQAATASAAQATAARNPATPAAIALSTAEAAPQKDKLEVAQKTPVPGPNLMEAPHGYYHKDDVVASYRKAAEQGIADAQLALGTMYANGQGVQRDYREAVAWYRKAAAQGCAKAQYNLGRMYINGQGVPYDYLQAVKWFNKAAASDSLETYHQKGILKRTASFR